MFKAKRYAKNTLKTLILPVGMFLLMFILTRFIGRGTFGSWASMQPIFRNAILGACIALAMTCNMLNRRWDFSVGMTVVLCPILVMPLVDRLEWGAFGLLILCIAAGLLINMINAAAYILIRVPSIVTSVGLMIFYESFIMVYNGGLGARLRNFDMLRLSMSPNIFIIGISAMLIFYIIFTHTQFGYNVRSLASKQSLAVNTGINEKKNVIGCYLLCGFFVGIAGAILVAMSGTLTATPQFNGSMFIMFQAFPPVFIGFYLMRYANLTIGVVLGAFTMQVLTTGMLALGIPSAMQDIGIGVFLMLFVAFTSNQERFKETHGARRRAAFILSTIEGNVGKQ
jgi:ribose transport system permease protein